MKQGWQYKKYTNKGSSDNMVHLTSLLLFIEMPLLEK